MLLSRRRKKIIEEIDNFYNKFIKLLHYNEIKRYLEYEEEEYKLIYDGSTTNIDIEFFNTRLDWKI